jgi:fluoroquinolone resistance protein
MLFLCFLCADIILPIKTSTGKENTVDLPADALIEDAEFKGQDYAGKEIKFKEIIDTKFIRCTFADAFFHECQFKNCAFIQCDLGMLRVKSSRFASVQFEQCKVVGVNWTEASWEKGGFFPLIDFEDCTLNYSTFFGLKLNKTKMIRCTALQVDFGEADLTGAVFSHTDLSGSIFMHTNLTQADFVNATNYNISAKNNTLKKAKFSLPEAMSLLRSLNIILVDGDQQARSE